MVDYKYKFEKHPNKKGTCPACGEKNQFRYYQDQNGERLSTEFGKCERTNSCGYHSKPSKDVTFIAPVKKKIAKVEYIFPDQKLVARITFWNENQESNLHKHWNKIGIPLEHFKKQGVGTDENGNTTFIHRNINGHITNVKKISYNPEGKRDKVKKVNHYLSQPNGETKKFSVCLFGEELLDPEKKRKVIIVESEKSKVIGSFYYPDYDWVACGSCNGLTLDKVKVLEGREVYWLCDADNAGRKNSSINNLHSETFNFHIVDLFPSREDGFDIADSLEVGNKPSLHQEINKISHIVETVEEEHLKNNSVDYRKNTSIWIKTRNNWEVIADNFHIFIKYQTKDDNEEISWIIEVKIKGRPSEFIEISHEDFCSAKKMKTILATKRLSFKANDNHISELHSLLFSTPFNTAKKITRFGFHKESETFFFSNKALSKNGELLIPDNFSIVNPDDFCLSMPLSNHKMKRRFELTENEITFNQWYVEYSKTHTQEKAFVPVCFYIMALFRDVVINHKGSSPILFLKGSAGTGKSSIIRSLTCLFGFQQEDINLKSKNTEAALVKLMSQSANSLIWMDEFHNEFPHEGLLQAAYDNAGYHKTPDQSKSKTDTDSIEIHSALALTSNYIPSNDIFFSRCLLVHVENKEKTHEQKMGFATMKRFEQQGLGCITVELLRHRQLIIEKYDSEFKKLSLELESRFQNENIPERLFSNMAQTMTCALILQKIGKIELCEYTDENDILTEFVNIGEKYIRAQREIQQENSVLSEFFGILQVLFENFQIQEGVHFRFENELLYLRLPSIFPLYKQKYRSIYFKESPDKDSILQDILKLEERDKTEILKTIRFREEENGNSLKNTVTNSLSITYEIYFTKFSLDFTNRRKLA
ncbi:DUF6371 domain-containing protein [Lacihabitans soyangensis]|uniref:DUF927 domain-containing protein n=1 Tax=Lacihabitans soyangensis TaxID=869394 RepID=A0AAE3GZT0_9BACT|nr:DUF6371 domain-containing protein [Lacihabitans soyangensis]MCP9762287.1 DUF927 domain-containing protein [Lacihabitans soyangensis]